MISKIATDKIEDSGNSSKSAAAQLGSLGGNKLDNHVHAPAHYFAFDNFCRIHKTLRMSPAMAAGITDRLWSQEDIVAKTDAVASEPKARRRYRKCSGECQ